MAKTFLVFSKEKSKKYILSGLLFLSLSFLVIIFYIIKTDVIKTLHNPFDVSYNRLATCQTDSDCIVANYEGCCYDKIAINKKYLSQYKRTPEWQKSGENCRFANCPWTELNLEPKCVLTENNIKTCTLSREPEAGYYLENCLAKYDFIKNGECEENCSNDKIYAFYVNDNGRFEKIMEGTSYLAKNYDGILSDDIKNKAIAVYEIGNCGDCTELFSIRESTGFSHVGVNSFCDFLYKQNLTCDNCIDVKEIDKPKEK